MNNWPETRQTLLTRLHDHLDQEAWNEFTEIYGPIILNVARRLGLQDADAADISQKVLLTVAKAVPDLQLTSKGSFRGWLCKVTTNAALNLLQRDGKNRAHGGEQVNVNLEQVVAPDSAVSKIWHDERSLQLFRHAANIVSKRITPENWQIFLWTAVEGQSISEASRRAGKSVGSIYALRSRVMAQLRAEVQRQTLLDSGEHGERSGGALR